MDDLDQRISTARSVVKGWETALANAEGEEARSKAQKQLRLAKEILTRLLRQKEDRAGH